jgi:hypothetical protein
LVGIVQVVVLVFFKLFVSFQLKLLQLLVLKFVILLIIIKFKLK